MASIVGKDGKVRLATDAVISIRNWDLTIDRDSLDDSELGDDWRAFRIGIGQWSGSFESGIDPSDTLGQLVLINAILNGTAIAELNLLTDDTPATGSKKGFQGAANFTSLGVGVGFDAIESGSYSFQGTDALAYLEIIT